MEVNRKPRRSTTGAARVNVIQNLGSPRITFGCIRRDLSIFAHGLDCFYCEKLMSLPGTRLMCRNGISTVAAGGTGRCAIRSIIGRAGIRTFVVILVDPQYGEMYPL
jgi:hypothetical protein